MDPATINPNSATKRSSVETADSLQRAVKTHCRRAPHTHYSFSDDTPNRGLSPCVRSNLCSDAMECRRSFQFNPERLDVWTRIGNRGCIVPASASVHGSAESWQSRMYATVRRSHLNLSRESRTVVNHSLNCWWRWLLIRQSDGSESKKFTIS